VEIIKPNQSKKKNFTFFVSNDNKRGGEKKKWHLTGNKPARGIQVSFVGKSQSISMRELPSARSQKGALGGLKMVISALSVRTEEEDLDW